LIHLAKKIQASRAVDRKNLSSQVPPVKRAYAPGTSEQSPVWPKSWMLDWEMELELTAVSNMPLTPWLPELTKSVEQTQLEHSIGHSNVVRRCPLAEVSVSDIDLLRTIARIPRTSA